MDQIGASHITLPDLLIVSWVLLLLVGFFFGTATGTVSRVAAVLAGLSVITILIMLFSVELSRGAFDLLSAAAGCLCFVMFSWNRNRLKEIRSTADPSKTKQLPGTDQI